MFDRVLNNVSGKEIKIFDTKYLVIGIMCVSQN